MCDEDDVYCDVDVVLRDQLFSLRVRGDSGGRVGRSTGFDDDDEMELNFPPNVQNLTVLEGCVSQDFYSVTSHHL